MTDVPADEMVARLRRSLETMLAWAELYAPRTLHERTRYDADLDQAEELLAAADAWMVLSVDRWRRKNVP